MAEIITLKMMGAPTVSIAGTNGQTHRCSWEAKTDDILAGDHVLALAQELVGSLPSGADEVPNPGDRMFFAEGKIQEDVGQTVQQFAAAFPNGNADPGALALDFECEQLEGDCSDYRINVVFRPPQQGQNEQPVQIKQFNAGYQSTIPFEDDPNPTRAQIAKDSVEYWMEYRPVTLLQQNAYIVNDNGSVQSLLVPMKMITLELFPPIEQQRLQAVLVRGKNVESPLTAINLNNAYENTMNNAQVNFGGFIAAAYTAHYESTTTSRPLIKNNSTYYREETRIVLHAVPQHLVRPAEGSYSFVNGLKRKALDEDGYPLERVPLKADGTIALLDSEVQNYTYSLPKPVSFSEFAFNSF